MAAISHQTIRLSEGKHTSPHHGACVMELASMLAGEPFTDHPASGCPVIGSFLRAYNDSIDDERRQDLYACASAVVGTRSSSEVHSARAARLTAWATEHRERRRRRPFPVPSRLRRVRPARLPTTEATGAAAVRAISKHDDGTHAEVLALIAELVAIDASMHTRNASRSLTAATSRAPGSPAAIPVRRRDARRSRSVR